MDALSSELSLADIFDSFEHHFLLNYCTIDVPHYFSLAGVIGPYPFMRVACPPLFV